MADGDAHYTEVAGAGKNWFPWFDLWLPLCFLFWFALRPTLILEYAFHCRNQSSAGGIDLELAPEVVTALDDVCVLSPRSFDAPSLAALLEEVCLWLVEQRIGPRAQHSNYKSCDPYAQV